MVGLCYTCLKTDRDVSPINSLMIKSFLWNWLDAGGTAFENVNVDEFKLCPDCYIQFVKLCKYRLHLFRTQRARLEIEQTQAAKNKTKQNRELISRNYCKVDTEPAKVINLSDDSDSNESNDDKNKDANKNKNAYLDLNKNKNKNGDLNEKKKNRDEVVFGNIQLKPNILSIVPSSLSKDYKLRSEPFVLIHKLKEPQEANNSKGATTTKDKKRKHQENSQFGKGKKSTHSTTRNGDGGLINIDSHDRDSPDLCLDDVEKFTILYLTRNQMLVTRDVDRLDFAYLKRPFKCETCILGFQEKYQYEKHNEEKHSELIGDFACPICKTRFNRQALFELHRHTHYRSYQCRHCHFQHHRRYIIENHVIGKHNLKPTPVCSECDLEFDTQQLLTAHYDANHKVRLLEDRVVTLAPVEKIKTYNCAHCTSKFNSKEAVVTHIVRLHRMLNHTCAHCNKGFSDRDRLMDHFYKKHPEVMLSQPKKDQMCPICSKKYAARSELLDHMRTHKAEKPFKCERCHKGFVVKTMLKVHMKRKHQDNT